MSENFAPLLGARHAPQRSALRGLKAKKGLSVSTFDAENVGTGKSAKGGAFLGLGKSRRGGLSSKAKKRGLGQGLGGVRRKGLGKLDANSMRGLSSGGLGGKSSGSGAPKKTRKPLKSMRHSTKVRSAVATSTKPAPKVVIKEDVGDDDEIEFIHRGPKIDEDHVPHDPFVSEFAPAEIEVEIVPTKAEAWDTSTPAMVFDKIVGGKVMLDEDDFGRDDTPFGLDDDEDDISLGRLLDDDEFGDDF